MKPLLIQIDGQPLGEIDVLDRGLHYGDGLFETIACRGHCVRFLDLHLERLTQGCRRLGFEYGDTGLLSMQLRYLATLHPASLVKLIVTRGSATARGYGPHGDERARTVVLQYDWPADDPAAWEQGIIVRTASGRLGENPALAGLKHLNRLEQVMIRREWTDPQIREALVYSSSGWLVSGTMSNVFVVKDGQLMTPAITHAGIRGVMRHVVLREAQRAGLRVSETTLTAAQLTSCEEIFLTNARIGIWPVRRIDARDLAIGPVTRTLQQRLLPLLEPSAASPPDA